MTLKFVDSFYFLALLNPRDAAHLSARQANQELVGPFLTTHWVLVEVADALAQPKSRSRFLNLMARLEADPDMTIVPSSEELFQRGIDFYRRRPDKDWPLTDCISFVVMKDQGISEALTGDQHFQQAGFKALLLNSP
jgi:predicted nucleic acid-binding protein